jgi:hypothetical protein
MAFPIAVLLFLCVSGCITLFGYRRYVRPGRVYETLAADPTRCSPSRLPPIRISSRSSGSPSASDVNFRPRPPTRLASSAR